MKKIPFVTLALASLMAALQWSQGASAFLALPIDVGWAGEPWRLFTYPLVHLNFAHFAWDAAAFLLLGTIVEMEGRLRYAALLLAAALVPGLAFLATSRNSAGIEGSSGLDSALFAYIGAALLMLPWTRESGRSRMTASGLGETTSEERERLGRATCSHCGLGPAGRESESYALPRATRRGTTPAIALAGALLLAAVIAKTAVEAFTGTTIFASITAAPSPAIFHAASIVTGALFAVVSRKARGGAGG